LGANDLSDKIKQGESIDNFYTKQVAGMSPRNKAPIDAAARLK